MSDQQLRRLQKLAYGGDEEAGHKLVEARKRLGKPVAEPGEILIFDHNTEEFKKANNIRTSYFLIARPAEYSKKALDLSEYGFPTHGWHYIGIGTSPRPNGQWFTHGWLTTATEDWFYSVVGRVHLPTQFDDLVPLQLVDFRPNPDDHIRDLQRLSETGDPETLAKLRAQKIRRKETFIVFPEWKNHSMHAVASTMGFSNRTNTFRDMYGLQFIIFTSATHVNEMGIAWDEANLCYLIIARDSEWHLILTERAAARIEKLGGQGGLLRNNPDDHIRELERRAYTGDREASDKLIAARQRAGLPITKRGEIVYIEPTEGTGQAPQLLAVARVHVHDPASGPLGTENQCWGFNVYYTYKTYYRRRPPIAGAKKLSRINGYNFGWWPLAYVKAIVGFTSEFPERSGDEVILQLHDDWSDLRRRDDGAKRNPDEDLRSLERRAYTGDREAGKKLVAARKRAGQPAVKRGELITGELSWVTSDAIGSGIYVATGARPTPGEYGAYQVSPLWNGRRYVYGQVWGHAVLRNIQDIIGFVPIPLTFNEFAVELPEDQTQRNPGKKKKLPKKKIKATKTEPIWFDGLLEKEFYRGVDAKGKGVGASYMGTGLYATWYRGAAFGFAVLAVGQSGKSPGKILTYKLRPGVKLLDNRSKIMINIKKELGVSPWDKIDSPEFAAALTTLVEEAGYEGVIDSDPFFGMVVFNPGMLTLVATEELS